MIEGSLIVFGVMLSYWIDLGFSFLEPSTISWRFRKSACALTDYTSM